MQIRYRKYSKYSIPIPEVWQLFTGEPQVIKNSFIICRLYKAYRFWTFMYIYTQLSWQTLDIYRYSSPPISIRYISSLQTNQEKRKRILNCCPEMSLTSNQGISGTWLLPGYVLDIKSRKIWHLTTGQIFPRHQTRRNLAPECWLDMFSAPN